MATFLRGDVPRLSHVGTFASTAPPPAATSMAVDIRCATGRFAILQQRIRDFGGDDRGCDGRAVDRSVEPGRVRARVHDGVVTVVLDLRDGVDRSERTASTEPEVEPARRPTGTTEFVCGSCFLRKPTSQLADPERSVCVDCAANGG